MLKKLLYELVMIEKIKLMGSAVTLRKISMALYNPSFTSRAWSGSNSVRAVNFEGVRFESSATSARYVSKSLDTLIIKLCLGDLGLSYS